MTDTLAPVTASLTEVHARLALCATQAHDAYAGLSSAQREVGRLRGALALFMADDHDDTISDNTKGFAQNVVHALDGLDRVLSEASRASLALTVARRDFTAQVKSWQDAATASPTDPAVASRAAVPSSAMPADVRIAVPAPGPDDTATLATSASPTKQKRKRG